jgi:phosphate transport system protein
MRMRGKFEYDLKTLRQKLMELGSLAEAALRQSIEAFQAKDIDKALAIMERDSEIDVLEEEINDFAILLIAKQQPVAIDLRRIIVAIKMATDIERIADFAVNIAKATIRIGDQPFAIDPEKIVRMHQMALEMVALGLKAYYDEDIALARQTSSMDDQVDELYGEIMRDLLQAAKANQDHFAQTNQLSLVARYLERTADHVTNMAEHVVYLVKGRHYDLNS